MKTYCFCTRDYANGQKYSGGMLHANSMEDAAERAIRMERLVHEITGRQPWPRHRLRRLDGRYVNLYISVHPEYLTNLNVEDNSKPGYWEET